MEKKKAILFTAASIVGAYLLGLLVLWLIAKIKNSGISGGNGVDDAAQGGTSANNSYSKENLNETFPMHWGADSRKTSADANRGVFGVQTMFRTLGYGRNLNTDDGIWGKDTEAGVDWLRRVYYTTALGRKVYPFRQYITSYADSSHPQAKWQFRTRENLNNCIHQYNEIVRKGISEYWEDIVVTYDIE